MTGTGTRELRRVVVTGLGAASPLGCGVERFWAGLLAGRSGIRPITTIDVSQLPTRIGGDVVDYSPTEHFSRKQLQQLSRASQLALLAATEAVGDAGLDGGAAEPARTAVILGASIGCISSGEQFFYRLLETGVADPLSIPVSMNVAPASNISMRWGYRGPLMSIDAACASANHAVGYAYNMIRFGMLDVALTGGADAPFSPGVLQAWSSMGALSERNDTPEAACRPFSGDRDGMVLGEHAGVLVLESEDSALRRNARIYAEITGYGATSDGYHLIEPAVEGRSEAMRLALADAGLAPEQVDYVNAHATATIPNDKTETEAIKRAFGPAAYRIPVVGIKGAIGHSLAASGALELISCALTIRDGIVPPTINRVAPDPDCDLDYVTEGKRTRDVRHALSNSFGFGGSNAVVVVSRRGGPA